MAQRADQLEDRSEFLDWLQEMSRRADLTAGKLQRLLVKAGWDVTAESTRRWLRGERVPPAEVVPYLLTALCDVLPKEEVHSSFWAFAYKS